MHKPSLTELMRDTVPKVNCAEADTATIWHAHARIASSRPPVLELSRKHLAYQAVYTSAHMSSTGVNGSSHCETIKYALGIRAWQQCRSWVILSWALRAWVSRRFHRLHFNGRLQSERAHFSVHP